jgi:hypothetical protein
MGYIPPILNFLHEWADAWVLLTAVGTIALAMATFRVVKQGQKLREDAAQQRRDIERQHRDRQKPICLLAPYSNVDLGTRRYDLVQKLDPLPENPALGRVVLLCTLKNIGSGPALKLKLRFRFLAMGGWMTESWELAPLVAGEEYGNPTDQVIVPIHVDNRFASAIAHLFAGEPWEILLDYEDVFGQKFQTAHSMMFFNPDPATFTWTTPPAGEQPKAIMQPIPWVNFIELAKKS